MILKVWGKKHPKIRRFREFSSKVRFLWPEQLATKKFSVFELAKMLPIQIINTELYRRVLRALGGKNHQNPQNPKDFYGV